jgi:hypothetical protein
MTHFDTASFASGTFKYLSVVFINILHGKENKLNINLAAVGENFYGKHLFYPSVSLDEWVVYSRSSRINFVLLAVYSVIF